MNHQRLQNCDLLEKIIVAYGGREWWQSVHKITVRLRFGGLAFLSKWQRTGLRERSVEVWAQQPKVIFHDYPKPGSRGNFTPNRVWLETVDQKCSAERMQPRNAFASLRRSFRWDHLDLLYFAGYACWNYLTVPFLLVSEGVQAEETSPWQHAGETWRRLVVRFPDAFPTHCQQQVFYFDDQLLLRRHDYTPEVFASRARAAHFCSAHRSYSGFIVPTARHVVPRRSDNSCAVGPKLVWIQIEAVKLTFNRHAGGTVS